MFGFGFENAIGAQSIEHHTHQVLLLPLQLCLMIEFPSWLLGLDQNISNITIIRTYCSKGLLFRQRDLKIGIKDPRSPHSCRKNIEINRDKFQFLTLN